MLVLMAFGASASQAAKGGDTGCPPQSQNPNGSAPNCGNGNGGSGENSSCKPKKDGTVKEKCNGGGTPPAEPAGACPGAALTLFEQAALICVFATANACPVGTVVPLTADGAPGSVCVLPAGPPAPPEGGGAPPLCGPDGTPLAGMCLPPDGGGGGTPAPPPLPTPDPATLCAPGEVPAPIGGACLSDAIGMLPVA